MGMPVKLSDELVESAREEAANTDRSITGQIEHWAKIGRSVETVLKHQEVQTLKRSPLSARLTRGARHAIQAALARVVADSDRRSLARSLQMGRIVYQSDPAGSGLTERIEPDGSRTLGRLINRRFVPARSARVGRR
jgi:ParD-like antitoxin of type II bacterial toxin-antitoxin system